MQIANQKHQSIYHTFHTQVTGLRPVNFNQVQTQIYVNQKVQTLGNKIVENIRQAGERDGNQERNDFKEKEDPNKVAVVETTRVNWVDAMGVKFFEDSENFPKNTKRYSLNMSEDLSYTSKANTPIRKKQSGASFQEKMDFKKNMESQQILKIFPKALLGSRHTCHISMPSKDTQNQTGQSAPHPRNIKNFTQKNLMTGEGKYVKLGNNYGSETSRQVKHFQQCEIYHKNVNKGSLNRFSQSPNKNKFGSEKSVNSSCSTNSTMFESTVMEPSTGSLFPLGKLENSLEEQTKISSECQTQNNIQVQKEQLYKIILELQSQINNQRILSTAKQNQIQKLQKLLQQNSIKYSQNIQQLQNNLFQKNQILLSEIHQKHQKQINEIINQINLISSQQLTETVSRFQISIKNVQQEYHNFKISNESEKSVLLGKIKDFEEIVKKMTDQIGTERINSQQIEQIDKQSQTSDSQNIQQRSSLDVGQFQQMEARLSKQQKYISKQQKKLKQYKVEYERTFHRAQDYRRYIQQNEMVIKDMEKEMKGLEKEMHEKNKNSEKLGCILSSCCEDLMRSELRKLNEKYRDLEMGDEGCQ